MIRYTGLLQYLFINFNFLTNRSKHANSWNYEILTRSNKTNIFLHIVFINTD